MRVFAFLFTLVIALYSGPILAGDNLDATYLAMVDKAKAQPESVNWADLRALYTGASFYKPYSGLTFWPAFEQAARDAATSRTPEAVAAFTELQRQHWANYMTHVTAVRIAGETSSDVIDVARSKAAIGAIADSVVASGDGSTAAKAFKIVTLEEEKLVVETFLDSYIKSLQPQKIGGRTYDVVTAVSNKTKKPARLFFDTSFITAHP
jgi:hypothetical protein